MHAINFIACISVIVEKSQPRNHDRLNLELTVVIEFVAEFPDLHGGNGT